MILNMNGGGASLNFKVVSGTTQPENPTENTIWVNMPDDVNEIVFSASRPENPVSGTLWICTSTSSSVSFNALKKNTIMIYPISVELFSSTSWNSKEAKIYQNGNWHDWTIFLIQNGVEKKEFTLYTGVEWTYLIRCTKTQNADNIEYQFKSSDYGYGAYSLYYIDLDLTGLKTIQISASSVYAYGENIVGTNTLVVLSGLPGKTTNEMIEDSILKSAKIAETMSTVSVDVSSLSGVHPVGIYTSTAGTVTLTVSDFSCI